MTLDVVPWGDRGPRVVLVHGDVFDGPSTFEAQRPLAEDHGLVVVNRRGFGANPDIAGEDFDVDAADVAALLQDEPAHLVGHSYGAVVCLLAAARVPHAVLTLTVFEPPAFGLVRGRPEVEAFVTSIRELLSSNPTPQDFLPAFVRAVGGDPSRLPTPLPAPLVRAAGVQMRGRWPWDAAIPLEELTSAPFPVLVVSGGHSPVFDAVCDVIEEHLHSRRAILWGAGHSIPRLGEPVNSLLRDHWAAARS